MTSLDALRAAHALAPADAMTALAFAEALFDAGDFAAVAAPAAIAVASHKVGKRARLLIARADAACGRWADAEVGYRAVLAAHGPSPAALNGAAEAILRQCRDGDALEFMHAALAIAPKNDDLRNRTAMIERALGHWGAAEKLLRAGLERRHPSPATLANLATVIGDRGDPAAAADLYAHALALAPDAAIYRSSG